MASHIYRHTVEWGDCDPAAIVFYPNFYRWMDASTWALFEAHGLPPAALKSRYGVFGTPLVETGAKYVSPARVGDALEIESHVAHWGTKSFRVDHLIRNGKSVCAEGYEVRVWGLSDGTDATQIRTGAIPDDVKALFD